jgi:hypothetical protein
MNGRIYDPRLGRMLSPDPVTQAPENGQNYNRYTYAYNNPLKYKDPSGFQALVVTINFGGGSGGGLDGDDGTGSGYGTGSSGPGIGGTNMGRAYSHGSGQARRKTGIDAVAAGFDPETPGFRSQYKKFKEELRAMPGDQVENHQRAMSFVVGLVESGVLIPGEAIYTSELRAAQAVLEVGSMVTNKFGFEFGGTIFSMEVDGITMYGYTMPVLGTPTTIYDAQLSASGVECRPKLTLVSFKWKPTLTYNTCYLPTLLRDSHKKYQPSGCTGRAVPTGRLGK